MNNEELLERYPWFDLPLLAAVPDLTGKGAGDSYYKTTSGKGAQS